METKKVQMPRDCCMAELPRSTLRPGFSAAQYQPIRQGSADYPATPLGLWEYLAVERSTKEIESLILILSERNHFRSDTGCSPRLGQCPAHCMNDAQNGKAKMDLRWPLALCFLEDRINKNRPCLREKAQGGRSKFLFTL